MPAAQIDDERIILATSGDGGVFRRSLRSPSRMRCHPEVRTVSAVRLRTEVRGPILAARAQGFRA
jgi:hypothetical protein